MADPFGNIPLNIGNAPTATPITPAAPSATSTPAGTPIPRAPIAPTPASSMPPTIAATAPAPIAMPEPSHARATPRHHTGAGPIAGIVIIVILFIFGGLYFWGAHLNAQEKAPLPLISGDPAQQ